MANPLVEQYIGYLRQGPELQLCDYRVRKRNELGRDSSRVEQVESLRISIVPGTKRRSANGISSDVDVEHLLRA
jgi:hypothetical protein